MIRTIWSTKNREPYLVKDVRPLIVSHSKDVYKHKGVALGYLIAHLWGWYCKYDQTDFMRFEKRA